MVGRIATLQEIETHWSWLDYVLANEALDIDQEIEAAALKEAQKR